MIKLESKEPWEWAILGALAITGLAVLIAAGYLLLQDTWTLKVEQPIPAPAESVFSAISDADRRVEWQFGVTAVTSLTGEPNEEGWSGLIYMHADRKSWHRFLNFLDQTLAGR